MPSIELSKSAIAGGALRTFFTIAEHWSLDAQDQQVLLGVSRSTLQSWRRAPSCARLSINTLERLSYLFNIWADLQIVLPREESADTWILRPNDAPIFGGRSPLERMHGGLVVDLYWVAQYTSAWRSA